MEEICSSAEETVHTGSVNTLSFTGNREGSQPAYGLERRVTGC